MKRIAIAACIIVFGSALAAGAMEMSRSPADQAYAAAMTAMDRSMQRSGWTGDPDRDFVRVMIPHHQSAIDMAKAELKYGKDPKVRALAVRIIAAQSREIREMNGWPK